MEKDKKNYNLEMAKYRLDCINNYISLADTKNSIGIAFTTITVSILSSIGLERINIQNNTTNCLSIISFSIFLIAILFLIISIVFFVISIIPRNNSTDTLKINNQCKNDKLNTFYYRHIGEFQKKEFIDKTICENEEEGVKEILEEVYYNSIICIKKMKFFKYGFINSMISIFISILSRYLYIKKCK